MPNEKAKQNPWLFFADNAQNYLDFAKEVAGIIKKEIKTPFQT